MTTKIALSALRTLLYFASGWLLAYLFSSGYTLQDKMVLAAMSAGLMIAGISLHLDSLKNHS